MIGLKIVKWFLICLNTCVSLKGPGLDSNMRHCSSPTGSLEGRLKVEEDGKEAADVTTLTWQIGLGETLCYRFQSESSGLAGTVEVTYKSLKSIYSIMDSYQFPLVTSAVSCLCDCPGGSSQCDSQTDLCGHNSTNCVTYYNPSARSRGCFLHFLHISAALCCQIQVQQHPHHLTLSFFSCQYYHCSTLSQVVPASRERYRAVHLAVPSSMAQFQTVYKNEEGEVVDTRTYNIDLNSGNHALCYITRKVPYRGQLFSLR